MTPIRALLASLALLAAACQPAASIPLPTPQIVAATPFQPEAAISASPSVTASAIPSDDLSPYAGLSIDELSARQYGGGELITLHTLGEADTHSRYLISYPSDGLTINGFMDVPNGEGPFPVVLLLHGYVEPGTYSVETYTARYAAEFAEAGFLVIHPNYRNHPPSDFGPNLFRVGHAIDVLNLIAIVREQAGHPGPLELADGQNIFLWGHSMGGGIAQRVLTVGAPVSAALLYASMSGDEQRNFEHIANVLSEGERGFEELAAPEEIFEIVSPENYYERIDVPVSIHHGNIDDVVPLAWSEELCARLQELGKEVECFTYRSMAHNFYGLNDDLLIQRSLEFFQRNLD